MLRGIKAHRSAHFPAGWDHPGAEFGDIKLVILMGTENKFFTVQVPLLQSFSFRLDLVLLTGLNRALLCFAVSVPIP